MKRLHLLLLPLLTTDIKQKRTFIMLLLIRKRWDLAEKVLLFNDSCTVKLPVVVYIGWWHVHAIPKLALSSQSTWPTWKIWAWAKISLTLTFYVRFHFLLNCLILLFCPVLRKATKNNKKSFSAVPQCTKALDFLIHCDNFCTNFWVKYSLLFSYFYSITLKHTLLSRLKAIRTVRLHYQNMQHKIYTH